MRVSVRRSAVINDAFEVVINNSLVAYYNKDVDKCLMWAKLHYKLSETELEELGNGTQ
jgi:hypothetical protein